MPRFAIIFAIFSGLRLFAAQEPVAPVAEPVAPPPPPAMTDDASRVAVLGYHDFSETLKETAMRIRTSKFRRQMETIRQLGIPVIPMEDFIAWKKGEKSIPEQAIVLTFDDGWRSVYTDAYPILKEFNFPFTLFLYKNYVDGGAKALTSEMVLEMMKHGGTIGSHSVSHPYPQTVKSHRKKGADAFDAFLRKEIGESKRFLESRFRAKVGTYCYPGGYNTAEMYDIAREFDYTQAFTVVPGKVKRSTPDWTIPRYVVLGNHDPIFNMAVTFREAGAPAAAAATGAPVVQTTPYPVSPEPGAIISSRLPEISADLSKVGDIDPATLVMRVSGFGEVPANYAQQTGKFSWQVNRRLRQSACQVSVTWKTTAGKAVETPLRWSFQLDREAAYLQEEN